MDFFSLMVSTAIIDIGVILLSLAVPLLYVGFAIIMYATYGFYIRLDFRSISIGKIRHLTLAYCMFTLPNDIR